ncbi:N-6 DNA methylase [Nocardia takedensis]|uniref:N-6 DNA methylase n=1 Tax=Nocardia takedensis TaxID=259390 RepID=UPI00030B0CF4|nr:N-6 DNA methylase [Nocardia takedensis]
MADLRPMGFTQRMDEGWKTLTALSAPIRTSHMRDLAFALVHRAVFQPELWSEVLATDRRSAVHLLTRFEAHLTVDQLLADNAARHLAIEHPDRLRRIIEVVDDLISGPPPERHVWEVPTPISAQVFSALLQRSARDTPAESAVPVPPEIERLAVELADPGPAARVYAPIADYAIMLAAAGTHLRHRLPYLDGSTPEDLHAITTGTTSGASPVPDVRLAGRAHSRHTMLLAALHLDLVGAHGRIHTEAPTYAASPDQHFDIVLAAPPWKSTPWRQDPLFADMVWPFGTPHATASYAWLQHSWDRLNPGGRAVVLMSSSAGRSRSPREKAIRAYMAASGVLEAVIDLPDYMFPALRQRRAASLWLLDKPWSAAPADPHRPGTRTPVRDSVLFISSGHGVESQKVLRAVASLRRGTGPEAEPGFCAVVPRSTITATDHDLCATTYTGPPNEPPRPSAGDSPRPATTIPGRRSDRPVASSPYKPPIRRVVNPTNHRQRRSL